MTRPLVIYHGNCADGFSAAWCFWRKFGAGADYVAGVYQRDPPDVAGRDVFMVDFSFKRPVVERLLQVASSVTLIDHHKTAIDDLQSLAFNHQVSPLPKLGWFCDINRSGATLAWDYLFPGEDRPLLLGHIEDRDLWKFKLANTREIQAFVFSHQYTFEQWDELMAADGPALLKMTAAGAAIERKQAKDVVELLGVCQRRMVIAGHDVPVASLPYTLVSDAAAAMAQGEPFAACYWDTADARVFGLRATAEGMDVSEIALQYGGGGHAKAAGFRVPRDHDLARA